MGGEKVGGKKEDLTGKTFNKLTVVRRISRTSPNGRVYLCWECVCSCGNPEPVYVVSYDLTHGHTKSCGCLRNEISANRGRKMWKKNNAYDLSGECGIGRDSNNKEFYFDLEDYEKIKNYYWRVSEEGYVTTRDTTGKQIRFHRLVMGFPEGLDIDHINHKMHDNRKNNLRICEHMTNMMNQSKRSDNTSGVPGVHFHKPNGMWCARIGANGKRINLGYFNSFEDAVRVRKEAEEKYYGEFSYENSMQGGQSCL
jgi:hypothetical protein